MVAQIAQTAVGLCFGFAALAKLLHFRRFEEAVASFEIVDTAFTRLAGIAVIVLESAVAFTFVSGFVVHFGVAISISLLTVFLGVTLSLEFRGVTAICMCFGGAGQQFNVPKALVRLILVGVGVGLSWSTCFLALFDHRHHGGQ